LETPSEHYLGAPLSKRPQGSPENRWEFDASEQPQHSRFLRSRQLPRFATRLREGAYGGWGCLTHRPFLGQPTGSTAVTEGDRAQPDLRLLAI